MAELILARSRARIKRGQVKRWAKRKKKIGLLYFVFNTSIENDRFLDYNFKNLKNVSVKDVLYVI